MSEELQTKLREAVKLLLEACHPQRIILFGSHARGTQSDDSDFDLLVIKETCLTR